MVILHRIYLQIVKKDVKLSAKRYLPFHINTCLMVRKNEENFLSAAGSAHGSAHGCLLQRYPGAAAQSEAAAPV